MKKYKLIKDIPTRNGTIKAGAPLIPLIEIQAITPQRPFYRVEGTEHEIAPEFIENNPEFFEEITRWKPKMDQTYFRLIDSFDIDETHWAKSAFDCECYEKLNCFQTKEQAEEAKLEIAKLLFKLHENL